MNRAERRNAERAQRKHFRRLGRDHPEIVHEIREGAAKKERIRQAMGGRAHGGAVLDVSAAQPGSLERLATQLWDEPVILRAIALMHETGARFLAFAIPIEAARATCAALARDYTELRSAVLDVTATAIATGSRMVFWQYDLMKDDPEAEVFRGWLELSAASSWPSVGGVQ